MIKTRLGLLAKLRKVFAFLSYMIFTLKELLMGFDSANAYLQRVGKISQFFILEKKGASIGENCDIETGMVFHNCKNYSNLKMGNNCHIGKNCFFDLRSKVVIENNVVISMLSTFITHTDMNKSDLSEFYPASYDKIHIKDNVYVGAKATIMQGVTLNENCMVASCALVREDVKPNTIVAGIPSKPIKVVK